MERQRERRGPNSGIAGTAASHDRTELFREAQKYQAQRRIRKAIREYEKLLSADPFDIDVHARVAPLYIKIRRKEAAKASLRQVIAWYEQLGFVDKAIAMLRLTLTVDRRDLAAHLHLADLYLGKAHKGDALKHLEGCRRTFRGRPFQREATAVEEKILSFVPDDFDAQVSLVRLLWRAGKRREAVERLRRMESQWASRRNKDCWRKTRRLLCHYAPSLSTGWACFISLFASPVPPGHAKRC